MPLRTTAFDANRTRPYYCNHPRIAHHFGQFSLGLTRRRKNGFSIIELGAKSFFAAKTCQLPKCSLVGLKIKD